jgi:hypothetical protein
MKKQAWTGVIAATVCTFAIGLSAQSTSSSASSTTRQSSSTAADHITVTGCLQRDTMSSSAGATGTSGSASASTTSASGFVLNVSPSSSSTGSTAGGTTAGGTTAGTSGTSASSYKLDSDESKLSPHVGHKVEITGTLDKSTSSSTAPSGSTSSASSSMSPKLKVDSVRMIAASCSN